MLEQTLLNNTGEILTQISPDLASRIGGLITIIQAVGIAFIIYVAYLVIKTVYNWKNRNSVKNIEQKIIEMDEKIDRLLKENYIKKGRNKNK